MEDTNDSKADGHRHSTKARVMGKLFGRDKKPMANSNNNNDAEVSAFLHAPSDKLYMTGAPPLPKLLKIDTSQASRWPDAAVVNRSREPSRARSVSLRRSRKGLIVRFSDEQPEIIGVGGDEADSPTVGISERKRSHSHPPVLQYATQGILPTQKVAYRNIENVQGDFRPPPLRRAQTGREQIPDLTVPRPALLGQRIENTERPGSSSSSLHASLPDPTSFAVRVKMEMRAAEGKALRLASNTLPTANGMSPESQLSYSGRSSPAPSAKSVGRSSPLPIPAQLTPGVRKPDFNEAGIVPSSSQVPGGAVSPDAVNDFSTRVQHLFKLFELSAESVLPLSASPIESLVKAASWWFLRGRTSIEHLIRIRPPNPSVQWNYDMPQQQAHADVAKSLWITKSVIARRPELKGRSADDLMDIVATARTAGDKYLADVLERSQVLTLNLRNLIMSMQRNDFLPPPAGEAPLPQGVDPSIWIRYPEMPQSMGTVLTSFDYDSINHNSSPIRLTLSEAMPLGDNRMTFDYGRMFVDVCPVERDGESQQRYPSILTVCREQTEKNLMIAVSTQNGLISLCVKFDNTKGPTWNDVIWQSRLNAIDVKLPRGLIARIQFLPIDYKTFWNMYDYTCKVHSILRPRKYEQILFDKIVKTFQYFDRDPQSRVFPKEPISKCYFRLLEIWSRDSTSISARTSHRGFRVAVTTGTTTKSLYGISHELLVEKPLQYGFMRGDEGAPALLLKFEDGNKNPTMVITFDDVPTRSQLHNSITGGARQDENILAYVPITFFSIKFPTQPNDSPSPDVLDDLEWQGVRVIQRSPASGFSADSPAAASLDSTRVMLESKTITLTDRLGMDSGEFRIRLTPNLAANEIMIIRKPQKDMSLSIVESQVPKEMSQRLARWQDMVARFDTIRKYAFPAMKDLHQFQAAVTGYTALYDGIAESFSISRRRMVVPLYKKWEASAARLQLLRDDKMWQIAVFFENFAHGECMNFMLKATDVAETFSRSGKFCVRFVDAKFALPRGGGDEDYDGFDKGYISLDFPDYPAEHDDITITFTSEADRDKFAEALPTPAKVVSKLSAVMR